MNKLYRQIPKKLYIKGQSVSIKYEGQPQGKKGYSCGDHGHISKDCPQNFPIPDFNPAPCLKCGKRDHMELQCGNQTVLENKDKDENIVEDKISDSVLTEASRHAYKSAGDIVDEQMREHVTEDDFNLPKPDNLTICMHPPFLNQRPSQIPTPKIPTTSLIKCLIVVT
ncbi:CNBP [Mytilus coruscus]|uniref:CNBP n=1 Tax=Mytilus coruscus TaxID=42192 RepID=A0A6J8AXJ2_MYTCO|nr:CNBP [Mytilus coruscus]